MYDDHCGRNHKLLEDNRRNHEVLSIFACAVPKPINTLRTSNISSLVSSKPVSENLALHPVKRMAIFLDLPPELRIMIYEYLLIEDVQPTVYKYPRNIPICNERSSFPEHIGKEAYSAYLTSNDLIFHNSRSVCLWLDRISSYVNTQEGTSPLSDCV